MTWETYLAQIRERTEKATKGPWVCEGEYKKTWNYEVRTPSGRIWNIGDAQYHETDPDAKFIAHSRTDIPALLTHIEELRAALNSLANNSEGFLSLVEVADTGYTNYEVMKHWITKAREVLSKEVPE